MTRVAQYLVHALFALNKQYFVSDKYAKRMADQFTLQPGEFMTRLERVLSHPGRDSVELGKSAELLAGLWLEMVELTDGSYRSRFRL